MTHLKFSLIWFASMVILSGVLWECFPPQSGSDMSYDLNEKNESVRGEIQPIPLKVKLNYQKVELGKKLFHDPRLSYDNTISCASCHDLKQGGDDGLKFSIGINGQIGSVNAPTVLNSAFNFKQFWDGRANTLEEQAEQPIHHPKEMGSNWSQAIDKLSQDKNIVAEFEAIYTDGLKSQNIQDVIAEFERSLITPNSSFDKYLRGDEQALTKEERHGYYLFKDMGCISCHKGVNVGGTMFQSMGKMSNYFKGKKISKSDFGRYNVTGKESDRFKFKVPSLRNVELTAPYFHDGSVETLEEAVDAMGYYQLGYKLTEREISLIVSFLKSLTGEYLK